MVKKELLDIVEIMIQIRKLKEEINDIIKTLFPKGAEIKWMHGRHIQYGTVTEVGVYGNIHVTNHKTGNDVRLDIFHVIEAHGLLNVLYPKLQSNKTKAGAVQENEFDGKIDNVRVFDRALSAKEIADEFQTGKAIEEDDREIGQQLKKDGGE